MAACSNAPPGAMIRGNPAMRRGARSIAIVGCLLGAGAVPVFGLDPRLAPTQYGHRVWTTEQGLPQNTIRAIVQARDGHVWLGTQEGLVRFDGGRFTVFDEKSVPAFRDQHV